MGKHIPKAKEVVYVGFVPNMSTWAFWVQEVKKIMTTNKVRFNEHEFPFQKRQMVEQHLSENPTDILFQQVQYNKLHVSNYCEVHHDKISNVVVLKVESQKNAYTLAIWSKYLADSNELFNIWDKVNDPIHAHCAGVTH